MNEAVATAPLPSELLREKGIHTRLLEVKRGRGYSGILPFDDLPSLLEENDLIVFNNSRLIKASLPLYFPDRKAFGTVNAGTSYVPGKGRIVEIRPKELNNIIAAGETAEITGTGSRITFNERDERFRRFFWAETLDGGDLLELASGSGNYIRYDHIPFDLPEKMYRTEFGRISGSVEFPSASAPFTDSVVENIRRGGTRIAEITLHCNLGSLELDEFDTSDRLLEEWYSVSRETARMMNDARKRGGRVIAVGTTVVRALESASLSGEIVPGTGITDLFIREGHIFRAVDAIITGMHEHDGSHIDMIAAFAGSGALEEAYGRAASENFLWHEFGDLAFFS